MAPLSGRLPDRQALIALARALQWGIGATAAVYTIEPILERRPAMRAALGRLERRGLAERVLRGRPTIYWGLTEKGRTALRGTGTVCGSF